MRDKLETLALLGGGLTFYLTHRPLVDFVARSFVRDVDFMHSYEAAVATMICSYTATGVSAALSIGVYALSRVALDFGTRQTFINKRFDYSIKRGSHNGT